MRLESDDELRKTICGTPNYIAPEVIRGKDGHSYPADIWSLGVIIYQLSFGKAPFETESVDKTYSRIQDNDFTLPDDEHVLEDCRDLISRIFKLKPFMRIKAKEILQHPFLTKTVIPKELPSYLMKAPPSIDWIQKFWPKARIVGDALKGRLNMELPRITLDEEKDIVRDSKFKRN